MNNLSWLIYLAEVSTSLKEALGILSGVSGIAALILMFGYFMAFVECADDAKSMFGKALKVAVVTFFVAMPLSTFIPSRQTVMLIAASEVGERVISSRQVQSVVDPATEYLSEWLQEQTRVIRNGRR